MCCCIAWSSTVMHILQHSRKLCTRACTHTLIILSTVSRWTAQHQLALSGCTWIVFLIFFLVLNQCRSCFYSHIPPCQPAKCESTESDFPLLICNYSNKIAKSNLRNGLHRKIKISMEVLNCHGPKSRRQTYLLRSVQKFQL